MFAQQLNLIGAIALLSLLLGCQAQPPEFAVNDIFDINIVKTQRAKTWGKNRVTFSELDDHEATVSRFSNPFGELPLTDASLSNLGSIKIVTINPRFVEIEFDLVDDATMGQNGIPKSVKLRRRKAKG